MYYFCIEDNIVTSILSYEPSVPDTIEVVQVTDEEYGCIKDDTHKFDLNLKKVIPHTESYLTQKQAEKDKEEINIINRRFLEDTDWKILRHIRQKALDIPTSLTEEEYTSLEEARHLAASKIS
jgi:hypothetical protein